MMGEVAAMAQLAGLDSLKLITAIVTASNNARMHKKNCKNFAEHLKLIGNLLEQLKISELREHPETSEPLKRLEEALRKAYVVVNSCKNNSYLYQLAMGWSVVSQFKDRQAEIDRLLHLIPLITLVENNRAQKQLQDIERDQKDYTLDEEEERLQQAVLKGELTASEAKVLQVSVSRRYPGLPINEELRKELEKMQPLMEPDQCDVIQHLIDITETDVKRIYEKDPEFVKASKAPRKRSGTASESAALQQWHHGLCGCCWDPLLCISTCICPCCTFATVAATATDGIISKRVACINCLICSGVLGCCFYTCCIRRKLRKRYNIEGGSCDDCWAHFLCFCCALVQERQEIKARAPKESAKQMSAPSKQGMERE